MFTRLGYFVIIAILAIAGAAIALVLWSAVSGGDTPSASNAITSPTAAAVTTPASDQPTIPFSRVTDFTRLGAVLSIDAQGTDVTVTFREDFDTSGFNTTSHVFHSSLEPGQSAIAVLQAAGIRVNGSDGVAVTQR
jgi:hypothetical protein